MVKSGIVVFEQQSEGDELIERSSFEKGEKERMRVRGKAREVVRQTDNREKIQTVK